METGTIRRARMEVPKEKGAGAWAARLRPIAPALEQLRSSVR